MNFTKLIGKVFGMVGKFISLIEAWVTIMFDWTDEVKANSDSALERYRIEREADDDLAMSELKDRLEKRRENNETNA